MNVTVFRQPTFTEVTNERGDTGVVREREKEKETGLEIESARCLRKYNEPDLHSSKVSADKRTSSVYERSV